MPSNDCFIVNGVLHKFDGTYLDDFHIHEFNNLNILVGSYPNSEYDCTQLSFKGVTGSLNLLTEEEMTNFD